MTLLMRYRQFARIHVFEPQDACRLITESTSKHLNTGHAEAKEECRAVVQIYNMISPF